MKWFAWDLAELAVYWGNTVCQQGATGAAGVPPLFVPAAEITKIDELTRDSWKSRCMERCRWRVVQVTIVILGSWIFVQCLQYHLNYPDAWSEQSFNEGIYAMVALGVWTNLPVQVVRR